MRIFIAGIIFRIIQIILLPVGAVGYLLWVVKLIAHSRRSGVSATVLASFYTRWMQHQLGTRNDGACERIMAVLPNVSRLGLRLVTVPTLAARRLTGYVPKIYRYPYEGIPPLRHQSAARTTFYDLSLERHLPGIDQLVILGAGLDTRAYRLPMESQVRCFEIDTPATQAFKLEMLKQAGVDTNRVTYLSSDFLQEDWLVKLVEAGFDPARPGFFLWESVTMFMDRETVEKSLRKIAGTTAGSIVAFDYLAAELIESRSFFMRYARAMLNAVGEPYTFGLDNTPPVSKRVAELLESCGLVLEEQRNFGRETDRKRVMAGFAIAKSDRVP